MTLPDAPIAILFAPAGRVPEVARALGSRLEVREISRLDQVEVGTLPALLLLDGGLLGSGEGAGALRALPAGVAVVSLDSGSAKAAEGAGRHFLSLAGAGSEEVALRILRAALDHAVAVHGVAEARGAVSHARDELRELNRIGMALMSERDPDRLLDLILTQARRLTVSDAASLYLVEAGRAGEPDCLHFRLAQNHSIPDLPAPDFTLPIDEKSIAGYAASTGEPLVIGDAYELPEGVPFTFNRSSFDEVFGYRAKSMLAVPMKDHRGRTVGVLQLINRKRDAEARVRTEEDARRVVLPYDERDVEVVQSLAGQAAVSIENGRLYRDIENLFEGFIKAAVTAIDQRDPTTSGHSVRVATLTCDLAEMVDRADAGPYKDIRFSREQMKELRYAGLLHDFGKVGVREHVLVKSKKLPPVMIERIEARFDLIRRTLEVGYQERRAILVTTHGPEGAKRLVKHIKKEYEEGLQRVDRYQLAVREANEPRVLPEEASGVLREIAASQFPDVSGNLAHYLTLDELHFLSIPKGSLDPAERQQIESHVSLTYQFLRQIPWTKDLSRVAEIAHGHHEKLDGTGYPRGVGDLDIPIQTRLMTVSDIFDALTASDRPYKKALPSERAISILEMESKGGQLDADVVQLLIDSEVYQRILREDWRSF
ncbi:MAG: GAF domain-containing protein [Gemmatimonadetes bacterium]|nr:GAF domain-containing protein [Gemmatimonadota bacterium]